MRQIESKAFTFRIRGPNEGAGREVEVGVA